MRLAHLHIPGLIPYSHSLRLQNAILERHFRYKDRLRSAGLDGAHTRNGDQGNDTSRPVQAEGLRDEHLSGASSLGTAGDHDAADVRRRQPTSSASSLFNTSPSNPPHSRENESHSNASSEISSSAASPFRASPPDPVLLTFSTPPIYTVGRRHLQSNSISPDQQSFLTANGLATFHASPRGGLLTYHAPGQVTGYVIADLRRHGITARCWVKLLEESVMRTCRAWGVRAGRTDDPGVWVFDSETDRTAPPDGPNESQQLSSRSRPATDRKICAIGVQVSRGIASHGVGLNVRDATLPPLSASQTEEKSGNFSFTPEQLASPSYEPTTKGYLSWGFSRIVACGLEGKSVTWLAREPMLQHPSSTKTEALSARVSPPTEEAVATVLADEIMHELNTMKGADKEAVEGVYTIDEAEVIEQADYISTNA